MGNMTRWLVLLGLFAGCSFALSGPDPQRPRGTMPKCDSSKSMVVLDSVLAAASGIAAISLAANNGGGGTVVPLAIGALFVGSAIHGNSVVNECRQANEAWLAEGPPSPRRAVAREDADEQPRKLPPPPQLPSTASPQPEEPAEYAARPQQAAPPPQQQPQPQPPQPQQPPPPPSADAWSNFWKEVR
jgi:hypothetical protein